MDTKVVQHFEDSLNTVRHLFMKAITRIDALKPGEKIPATKLAEDLGREMGKTGNQIYPVLKILLNDSYPGVKVLRGAHGGIAKLPETTTPVVVATDVVEETTEVSP